MLARPHVFTNDATLRYPTSQKLRAQAPEYVHSGGVLITMGLFGLENMRQAETTFKEFGLPWKATSNDIAQLSLNSALIHFETNGLPLRYGMQGVHPIDVEKEDCLYVPMPESVYWTLGLKKQPYRHPIEKKIVAVAVAKVGDGMFGCVGVDNYEDESAKTLLAMLGVQE